MTRFFILLSVLALAALACSIQAGAALRPTVTPDSTSTLVIVTTQPTHTPTASPTPLPTATATPAAEYCTVTGSLNIRSGAGVEYRILETASNGDRLLVVQWGDWANIETSQGISGWISSGYCVRR